MTSIALIAGIIFVIAIGVFISGTANGNHATEQAVQQMDAIVVTAPRLAQLTLDTIIIAASRNLDRG